MPFARPEDWVPQGIASLEPNAMQALQMVDHSVCVIASAGAGKTEFLAQKAAYLLQTGLCRAPQRILAISFKRDAAKNLRDRVYQRCAPEQARRFDSLTFDAFTKNLVDRFGPAIPQAYRPSPNYQIVFAVRADWQTFLRHHNAPGESEQKLERYVANTSLPICQSELSQRWKELVDAYWQEANRVSGGSALSFHMINRLAEYLIRSNKQVCRALRLTYPYVFLDEFQDTTAAQYELLTTAFLGSEAKLTAVGDDKQRIMGWAGAMNDGFQRLKQDFETRGITLLSNWRSHNDLVTIQHVIATMIDGDAAPSQARAERTINGDIAAIWHYRTQDSECEGIADWITHEIEGGVIQPNEVAILVRLRAEQVEKELRPTFAEKGLVLRNVARNVGDIAIQDLLAEELTSGLVPLLRLGCGGRAPEQWQAAMELQRGLRGIDAADEDEDEVLRADLEKFVSSMKQAMADAAPAPSASDIIVAKTLAFLGETALRRAVPAYRRERDFHRVLTGFRVLLGECTEEASRWPDVLDRFEGVGQIPLMTIHKSKGLEFHTMIFFGLDSRTWWSLEPDRDEELKSFFVAFTRAKQRAFFTCCGQRGKAIAWMERLLGPAGVTGIDGPG